jgi:hypothetical protein
LWLFLTALPKLTLTTASGASSGFRYGTISWTSEGSLVNFTIQTAFQRVINNITLGDIVQLSSQESPQFLYGDSRMAQILKMKVTSFSVERQFLMGEVALVHRYASPVAPDGKPWKAQYIGCCRLDNLQNNAGRPWVLTAEIDLNRANKSPLPRILPTVTVPFSDGVIPQLYVASDDQDQVEWSLGTPFDVGGSVRITPTAAGDSSLRVNIGNLYEESKSSSLDCTQTSSAPGCLYRLLLAKPELKGFSVEGWVKSESNDLGYVLSSVSKRPERCNSSNCNISTL